MTRWERMKEDAKILAALILLGVIVIVAFGYPIAKEVQWWRTSRALERSHR